MEKRLSDDQTISKRSRYCDVWEQRCEELGAISSMIMLKIVIYAFPLHLDQTALSKIRGQRETQKKTVKTFVNFDISFRDYHVQHFNCHCLQC